jgi:DNA-binding transcriptional LysR family regulator
MTVTKDRVMYAADTAKPYLGLALHDDEFRDNLRAAFAAARAIYAELGGQRGLSSVASRVATDEDIHANLRRAIKELRQAADRLQQREEESRSHAFRNVALLASGIAIGIFFNPFTGPTARRWVTGKVGGSSSTDPYSPNGSS